MKNSYIFLFLLYPFIFFPSFQVLAQKNLVEGYVVTLKKDTLKGVIDYREWNLNPTKIHFTDKQGNKKVFSPDDIAGFVIPPRDHYISKHVTMDVSSLRTGDLMEYEGPKEVKDTALFLLTLVKGKASLYYQKDKDDREHFYVSKEDSLLIELLLKKSYVKTSEGKTLEKGYTATVELFKGQLLVLFKDCPDLKGAINNSAYSISSLLSIVMKYNECRHSTIEFIKKEEKTKVNFGVVAGPTITMISFKGGDSYLTDIKLKNAYSYLAGVSFNLIFPRERAQWSLVDELVYKPYSTTTTATEYTITGTKQDFTFAFKMGYVKLYTLARYQFPKGSFRPFAELGMSNGYAFKSVNTETVVTTFGHSITTRTAPAVEDAKLYEFGLVGGAGVSWKKFSAGMRYEWAQGMSPQFSLTGPENTIILVISFFI